MLVSPIYFLNLPEAPKAAKNSSKLKPNACGENQRKHPWNPFRGHSFHHDMAHHTVATARGNNSKTFGRISQAEDIFTVYEEFPVKVLGVEESWAVWASSRLKRLWVTRNLEHCWHLSDVGKKREGIRVSLVRKRE